MFKRKQADNDAMHDAAEAFGFGPASALQTAPPPSAPAAAPTSPEDEQDLPTIAPAPAPAEEETFYAGGDFEALWSPQQDGDAPCGPEQMLLEQGTIRPDQLEQARSVQRQQPGRSLCQVLIAINACTEEDVQRAVAQLLGLAFEQPDRQEIDVNCWSLLTPDYIRNRRVAPIRVEDERTVVAVCDPNDVFLLDEVKRKLKRELTLVVTTTADIVRLVEQMSSGSDVAVDEIIKDMADDDVQVVEEKDDDVTDLEKMGNESPVIRFVNFLIQDAIKQGASDVHIEPKEKQLKVRYRIDGVLFEAMNPPHSMHAAIVSRMKIMANLDIAERRLPQDGRIRAVVQGRKVDLRMSTLPTAAGEKVVVRILDNSSINVPLEALGFSTNALEIWRRQIDEPHGILLVTGPTGSGKTTTLYSSLRVMDGQKLNISTVEDPVEYHLGQANQVQVHDKIGMTFAAALRSLLRQDPDVVMLGEIRDGETAHIAVQASLTGHLVLSTLHTNDAPSSITRLINIGIEPYLISAALNAVLAQRLVRKICPACKQEYDPTDEMKEFLVLQGFSEQVFFKGAGCDKCRQTGYAGRLGIYELLIMDDSLRDMVTGNPDVTQLRKLCRERGLVSLREDGFDKAAQGLTTVDEILRVTESAA